HWSVNDTIYPYYSIWIKVLDIITNRTCKNNSWDIVFTRCLCDSHRCFSKSSLRIHLSFSSNHEVRTFHYFIKAGVFENYLHSPFPNSRKECLKGATNSASCSSSCCIMYMYSC